MTVATMTTPSTGSSEIAVLVERARSGEREAFGELVERQWSELVSLARAILAADDPAEDLVQESLVHAWRRLWMLRRPETFPAWTRRIVTRRCLSWARRQRPPQILEEPADDAAEPGASIDTRRLLAALTPRQRAALHLTWIAGCTDREAGRILGLRPATVRVHRHRGLLNLRRIVEKRP